MTDESPVAAADLDYRRGRDVRFLANKSAVVGAVIVALIAAFALVGPLISGADPFTSDFLHGLDPVTELPTGPSAHHWLGTDRAFRDVLARLASGARFSLLIGFAATGIAITIGTIVGLVAGWFEGERFLKVVDVDSLLMRSVDIGLSFPFLLLVMAISATVDRTTTTTIFLVLGLTSWLGTARIVRAKTMVVRRLEFVEASHALGQRTPLVLLRHILPNVAGPIVVIGTAQVAQMILAESVLAYLGMGVSPPTPTWGAMLFEGQDYFGAAPWMSLAPGLAILLTVLGFNLIGEGLRDALDPRESA